MTGRDALEVYFRTTCVSITAHRPTIGPIGPSSSGDIVRTVFSAWTVVILVLLSVASELFEHLYTNVGEENEYRTTKIGRPQSNGSIERFNRTLLELQEGLVGVLVRPVAVLAAVVAQDRPDLHAVLLEEGQCVVVQDLNGGHRHPGGVEPGPVESAGAVEHGLNVDPSAYLRRRCPRPQGHTWH